MLVANTFQNKAKTINSCEQNLSRKSCVKGTVKQKFKISTDEMNSRNKKLNKPLKWM